MGKKYGIWVCLRVFDGWTCRRLTTHFHSPSCCLVRLRLVSPRATSLPYTPADVFSLLLLLLLSLPRGRYSLLPLPCVVSATRCWCAAAVLRCCCWGPPLFPDIPPPWTTPSTILPVFRYFLLVPPNSGLFGHCYMFVFIKIGLYSQRQFIYIFIYIQLFIIYLYECIYSFI